jgi:hypothetical protein
MSKPTYTELRDALAAAIKAIELLQAHATAEAVESVQPRLARFKDIHEWAGRRRRRNKPSQSEQLTEEA